MTFNKSFQTGKWVAAFFVLVAILAYLFGPRLAKAQQVTLTPDSLRLAVGDTARVTATVRGAAGLALSFRGTNATAFTVHRDGRVTARAAGCGYVRVGVIDSAWSRGQVRVCVAAAAPVPDPDPTPIPTPDPVPQPDVVFSSDWSHALGNTFDAITDGRKWPMLACGSVYAATAAVVEASPLGFSLTPHVLRMQMRGPSGCAMLQVNNVLPASTTHWGRFYVRNDERGTRNGHATGYNNAHYLGGSIQAVPWTRDARTGGGAPGPDRWMMTIGGSGPYPFTSWLSPALEHGVWYRYEWQMEYLSATTFRFWPRVFGPDGSLLYEAQHFRHWESGSDPTTLAQWYARGNVMRLDDPEGARHFGIGNEGPSTALTTYGYWYYARFALSTRGWIGQ